MPQKNGLAVGVAALITGLVLICGVSWSAAAAEEVSFKLDVFPILESRCVKCHQPGGEGVIASGLDLTSYAGLMRGTKHGPIVIPGQPLVSNLNVLIEGRADPRVRMPHDQRPLLRAQQEIIREWVRQGAKDN